MLKFQVDCPCFHAGEERTNFDGKVK